MTTSKRLFGTDGIRGTANIDPMTAETALKLGQAAGLMFVRGSHRHRVVIGKDTRLSGYLIEPALVAGFIGAGMDVTLVGPLPTPSFLSESRIAPYAISVAGVITEFAPKQLRDGFVQQMEKLKQLWVKPSSNQQGIV